MNLLKARRFLILVHLYLASIAAPSLIMVAVSGALYLANVEAKVTSTPVSLPQNAALDFQSKTLEDDIRALLQSSNIDIDFEYIRSRGNLAMTRPTSREHVVFKKTPNGLTASLENPGLQYSLMELHKGHGPKIFRTYQILAGISLFLIVLGGLIVGMLAKNYRKPTLITTGIGLVLFLFFAFVV